MGDGKVERHIQLAREFSRVLRTWLTVKQMEEIFRRNVAETDPLVCHSHDFCDANEAMLEAATKLGFKREIDDQLEKTGTSTLWVAAWNYAKESGFKSPHMIKMQKAKAAATPLPRFNFIRQAIQVNDGTGLRLAERSEVEEMLRFANLAPDFILFAQRYLKENEPCQDVNEEIAEMVGIAQALVARSQP